MCDFSIGGFVIEWSDCGDYVVITDSRHNKKVKICGGDFESLLQGLVAIERVKNENASAN